MKQLRRLRFSDSFVFIIGFCSVTTWIHQIYNHHSIAQIEIYWNIIWLIDENSRMTLIMKYNMFFIYNHRKSVTIQSNRWLNRTKWNCLVSLYFGGIYLFYRHLFIVLCVFILFRWRRLAFLQRIYFLLKQICFFHLEQ